MDEGYGSVAYPCKSTYLYLFAEGGCIVVQTDKGGDKLQGPGAVQQR